MNCSRCGEAEAVIQRDNAFYCGRCILARDWEEVIALVQRERIDVDSAPVEFSGDELPPAVAGGEVPVPASSDPYS